MNHLTSLREQFKHNDIDGMLITSSYNRKYLTGFTGTAGVALVSGEGATFITDFRYVEQAESQIKGFEIVQHKIAIQEEVAKQVKKMGIKRLGFEKDHLTYGQYDTYKKSLEVNFVPVSGLVEKMRLLKSPEELKVIQEAVDIYCWKRSLL